MWMYLTNLDLVQVLPMTLAYKNSVQETENMLHIPVDCMLAGKIGYWDVAQPNAHWRSFHSGQFMFSQLYICTRRIY
jgi:hypothetical protein